MPDWVHDAVFYQIFPERFANGDPTNDPPNTQPWGSAPTRDNYFGGDLAGILQHLDYIASLGVTALYLTPVFASPTNHKYHTTDYLQIDPHFGDEATLRQLVQACHRRGLRVVLDAVFNHTGVDFFAFQDIKERGRDSPYFGWYNIHSLPLGPPSAPNYDCWADHGALPKLVTTHPAVQQYLLDVTRYWMRLGINGWRLDAAADVATQFWTLWRPYVTALDPQAYVVGELWKDASVYLRAGLFDAATNYPLRRALLDCLVLGKLAVSELDALLQQQRANLPPAVTLAMQNLLGSHDTARILTYCAGDKQLVKLLVLLQMTYPGSPIIYYGDEIGMTGGPDPECRATMVWDVTQQDAELLAHYRQLIALRKQHAALRRGTFSTLTLDDEQRVYAYCRSSDRQVVTVAINASRAVQRVRIAAPFDGTAAEPGQIWPAQALAVFAAPTGMEVELPPLSGALFAAGPAADCPTSLRNQLGP